MPTVSAARRITFVLDRIIARITIIVLVPVWLLIAALARWISPGPIIDRRRVLGCGGRPFDAFKFRTAVVDADRILAESRTLPERFRASMKVHDDPRLTRVGRFLRRTSFDALPLTVQRRARRDEFGGPRLIAPEEADRYGAFLARRVSMRPGMTGLWQVSWRQELSYERRIELDREYLDNWPL